MVTFKSEGVDETYTIEFIGGKENYIYNIKALLRLVINVGDVLSCQQDINCVCDLIYNMLPDAEQIVSLEDAELLKTLKNKPKK
jgi:hypothetical protein